MIAPTPPGFIVDTPNISVMFVSGYQSILGWHNAEYVIGWKTIMKMILGVFEEFTRMEDIKKTLSMMLLGWAKDGWMGRGKDVLIDLKITEEDFLPFNVKQVKIQFFDDQTTLLRFYVRKDKIVKKSRTLKQITLQNLSFVVDKPTSVGYLELPIHLAEELEDEIENCWKSRYILEAQTAKKPVKIRAMYPRQGADSIYA